MKRKIGLSFWVNSDPSQIFTAIEAGCDYLEVCLEFPFLSQKRNVKLLKEIKDNGLEVAFESPQGAVQIFNPIDEISRTSMKIMRKILQFCSKFDPLYFNFHQIIDIPTYELFKEKIRKRKIEVTRELSRMVDFPLTFENTVRKSLSTPEQFSFIKNFNNAFICLDVGHLPRASFVWGKEIGLEQWIKTFKNKILTLHLHNVQHSGERFYDHLSFSHQGLVDMKKVFEKTRDIPYIVAEIFYLKKEKPVNKATLVKDLEKIKKFYKKRKKVMLSTCSMYSREFYKFYERNHPNTPNLKKSLHFFKKMGELKSYLRLLKNKEINCLIEGYACPYNAFYLYNFLKRFKIKPVIFVIDISRIGYESAKTKGVNKFIREFIKASATNTGLESDTFDLIVQDFLLNCSPFHLHEEIIRETSRILKLNGLFLVSYSYLERYPKVPLLEKEIIEKSYKIKLERNLSFKDELKRRFKEKMIKCREGIIFVTSTGDFEFYRRKGAFEKIFLKYFEFVDKKMEVAKDRNGLLCQRWREVYRKT